MAVLPYKDRLELFSRYLQQLVMESLGKEKDLSGKVVHQGLTVYGNKGSTDQHAYIQQLRDGLNNFFVIFIQVLRDREGDSMEVDPRTTSGDYLLGFLLGTRQALYESSRESVKITLKDASPQTIGCLIALFERAVGFYASLINVNAYHQPGVEAGKKAATAIVHTSRRIRGSHSRWRTSHQPLVCPQTPRRSFIFANTSLRMIGACENFQARRHLKPSTSSSKITAHVCLSEAV